jgi:uncharacterized protein YndB with AHSA1/START domain
MPVIDVTHNLATLNLTIVAEFAAPVQRIWDLYADPRQLERVWGPPSHPATFVDHALTVGARTTYFMTGPGGEKYHGYWIVTRVEEPHRFCFDDGFADADFNPDPNLPVSKNDVRFEAIAGGTRATYSGTYASREALEQVLAMGVVEGATSALNQIDGLLAAGQGGPT